MSNKILRFIDILKENYDFDEQFINELTHELKDDFIKFEIHKGYFSLESYKDGLSNYLPFKSPAKKSDKLCYCIEVNLESYLDDVIRMKFPSPLIHGNKIFKIFSYLNKMCEQVDDSYIMIRSVSPNMRPYHIIYLYLLSDEDIDDSDAEMMNLFYTIQDRFRSQKSDFANNTIVTMSEPSSVNKNSKITITISSEYTDRKLQLMLRGIDLSNYNMDKKVSPHASSKQRNFNSNYNYDSAEITITKK